MVEDYRDAILVNGKSSDSSDQVDDENGKSKMNISNARSDENRKLSTKEQKGKKKKISALELLFSID